MAGKQMRAVIVGAGTLLGKELAEELNNSAAVAWETRLLDEAAEGETQLSAAGDEAVVISPLNGEALEGADLVFFAGDPATTREYWHRVVGAGAAVVDLSGALEGETGVAVRCPWLPGGAKPDLTTVGVVAAHPAALMLAMAADRLSRRGLTRISATILEPASQAGAPGLDELHQQTVSLLSFQSVPREIFDTQVAFNVQATLGEASRIRLGEVREHIRRHLRLLAPEIADKVALNLLQAPVFHGYTVSALVAFERPVSEEEVRTALNGGVIVADVDTEPSNLAAAESGDLLISVRSEQGGPIGPAHWLWMAADNLRLAARGAVAAAMELAALRPTLHVQ